MPVKKIKRRDFLKTTALGTAGIALGVNPVIGQNRDPIDRLYENSIRTYKMDHMKAMRLAEYNDE